jgi:hypothetical protein
MRRDVLSGRSSTHATARRSRDAITTPRSPQPHTPPRIRRAALLRDRQQKTCAPTKAQNGSAESHARCATGTHTMRPPQVGGTQPAHATDTRYARGTRHHEKQNKLFAWPTRRTPYSGQLADPEEALLYIERLSAAHSQAYGERPPSEVISRRTGQLYSDGTKRSDTRKQASTRTRTSSTNGKAGKPLASLPQTQGCKFTTTKSTRSARATDTHAVG